MKPVPRSGLSWAPENSLLKRAQFTLQPRLVYLSRHQATCNACVRPKFWSMVKPMLACLVGNTLTPGTRLPLNVENDGLGTRGRRLLERTLKHADGMILPGKGCPGAGTLQPVGSAAPVKLVGT